MNKNNLSLYCHFSTENAYATAELDSTVPIIVDNEMKIEDDTISEICFKSIFDRNNNSRTLEKINADVEKLLGKTNKQIVDAGTSK